MLFWYFFSYTFCIYSLYKNMSICTGWWEANRILRRSQWFWKNETFSNSAFFFSENMNVLLDLITMKLKLHPNLSMKLKWSEKESYCSSVPIAWTLHFLGNHDDIFWSIKIIEYLSIHDFEIRIAKRINRAFSFNDIWYTLSSKHWKHINSKMTSKKVNTTINGIFIEFVYIFCHFHFFDLTAHCKFCHSTIFDRIDRIIF